MQRQVAARGGTTSCEKAADIYKMFCDEFDLELEPIKTANGRDAGIMCGVSRTGHLQEHIQEPNQDSFSREQTEMPTAIVPLIRQSYEGKSMNARKENERQFLEMATMLVYARTTGRSCAVWKDRPEEYEAACVAVEAGEKESYSSSAVI